MREGRGGLDRHIIGDIVVLLVHGGVLVVVMKKRFLD